VVYNYIKWYIKLYNIVNPKWIASGGSGVKATSIRVSVQTKGVLDSIKHPGQSYDGAIQDLLKLWKKAKRGSKSAAVGAR